MLAGGTSGVWPNAATVSVRAAKVRLRGIGSLSVSSARGQGKRVEGTASAHHHILPVIQFIGDGSVAHPADGFMPQRCAVAGPQRQHVAGDVAAEGQAGCSGEYASRARAVADGMVPDNLPGP